MHFRLILEYDGSEFCGWQVQPDQRTLQGVLEEALLRLVGQPVRVAGAGRTDSGVHAAGQVACFRTARSFDPGTVLRALNALTPADLVIRAVDVVPEEFDPRRSARSRTYVYRLWNRSEPSPFWRRYAWHCRGALDVEKMQAAAARLLGEHDFTSFRAAGCEAAHPIRRVLRSSVHREGDLLRYEIEATAFLRHMVRNIVGTLLEVGRGERTVEDFERLLIERDRDLAGITAPAHGLCLVHVQY